MGRYVACRMSIKKCSISICARVYDCCFRPFGLPPPRTSPHFADAINLRGPRRPTGPARCSSARTNQLADLRAVDPDRRVRPFTRPYVCAAADPQLSETPLTIGSCLPPPLGERDKKRDDDRRRLTRRTGRRAGP